MLQLTTIVFLIAFFTLAVVHNIATELFLYWHIWWLDIFVHGFGGAIVALGLYTLRDLRLFPNTLLKPVPVLCLVLVAALLWEAYELLIGIPIESDYIFDTVIDICMGLFGGVLGFIIGHNLRHLR
jgi:hypothetical protein